MKKIIFLLPILLLLSCASSTNIRTLPEGAKVTEDGALKGVTPYMHFDRDVEMAGRTFTLKKEGYKDKTITIKKTDFYVHRLIAPPIIGWLWLFGYPYEYFYELEEDSNYKVKQNNAVSPEQEAKLSKTDDENTRKLRELKKLQDEGLLTNKEYEMKKKAILDVM